MEMKIRNECKATYFIELADNKGDFGIIAVFADAPEKTKEVARLIAAAPQLLEACETGLSYVNAEISSVPRPIQDLEEDKKQIEAALTAAKPT